MPSPLSRVSPPTLLLYVFLVVTQFVKGMYAARGIYPPGAYVVLYPLAFLWVVGWWMQRDSRKRGVGWVLDMGLFLYVAWPFVLPYYLFKTRGAKALLTMLAFVGVYVAAFLSGAVLYALINF